MEQDHEYLFKILLVGNTSVGKSSLLLRFSDDEFYDSFMPTIGVDFKIKTVEVDGKRVKLEIWDTAGEERFRTITSSYYKGAHGVFIVYDVTNHESFIATETWMDEVGKRAHDETVRVLLANKTDLTNKRMVFQRDCEDMARDYGVKTFETSAKDNNNVELAFVSMARQVLNRFDRVPRIAPDLKTTKIHSKGVPVKEPYWCCY